MGQDGSDQIHDYEPGIHPNGLFWTIPITPDAIEMDLQAGTAHFAMTNLAIPDFSNFPNSIGALMPAIPVSEAMVTFDVTWQAMKPLTQVRDAMNHFTGDFRNSAATITWSVNQPAQHFQFATDQTKTTTIGGVLGQERNGVHFS